MHRDVHKNHVMIWSGDKWIKSHMTSFPNITEEQIKEAWELATEMSVDFNA